MALVKTCFKCGIDKPIAEYYAHPKMADGLLNKCKVCARRDARNNYASRPEYYRAYDRERNAAAVRKAKARASWMRAAAKHPERKRASDAVAKALRIGALKQHPCWVCGEKAQAHHPDYSRPLDVVWLCVLHHRQAHAITRRLDDDEQIAA